MGVLTRYGRFDGHLPRTAGNVFYVAPSSEYRVNGVVVAAKDNAAGTNGTDPMKPFATLAYALTQCTANNGDTIVLLPGTHTLTANIAISSTGGKDGGSLAGITITGMNSGETNWLYPRVVVTSSTSVDLFTVTVADVEFEGIRFTPVTQKVAISFSAAASRLYVHDCAVDMVTAAASTSTKGFVASGAAGQVLIDHVYFSSLNSQGPILDMTATTDSTVQRCIVQAQTTVTTGVWASMIAVGAATDRLLIRDCEFQIYGTGTCTKGIDGTGASLASAVQVERCIFAVGFTTPVTSFDAGEAELGGTYVATIGGGTGGTLITAIA